MSKLLTDEELHNHIFEIAEVNVTNQETGKDLYAIDPIKLIEFIKAHTNKAIGEVLDRLAGQGERGGHDVFCRTIGEALLAERKKLEGEK